MQLRTFAALAALLLVAACGKYGPPVRPKPAATAPAAAPAGAPSPAPSDAPEPPAEEEPALGTKGAKP
jgi:hypothetical protein